MSVGNAQNMAKVREAMAMKQEVADEVNLGEQARNLVTIDYTSGEGAHYTGTIEFKRPSIRDTMAMGAGKSEILRNAGVVDISLVDSEIILMAEIISTLKVVVVKCPVWFMDIEGIEDVDVIFHVYGKYREWRDSFRPKAGGSSASGDSKTSE